MTVATEPVDQTGRTGDRRAAAAPRRSPWRRVLSFKYLSLAPLIVLSLVFVVYPLIELIKTALGELNLTEGQMSWRFVGLDNFAKMLDDDTFPVTIVNSVVFVGSAVTLTVVIGVVLAFLTDRAVRFQSFFQNVLIWPAVLAPVVISVLWLLILSPQVGLINHLLNAVGLDPQAWLGDPVGAMASVVFVDTWHWTPIVYLLIYTALRSIDSSILQAAAVDGAGYWRTVRSVVLPLITPAILGVIAVRIIMGVKVFDEMYLLTFGGPGISTTVISLYIRSVFFDQLDFGYGSALSLTVILAVLIVLLIIAGGRWWIGKAKSRHG